MAGSLGSQAPSLNDTNQGQDMAAILGGPHFCLPGSLHWSSHRAARNPHSCIAVRLLLLNPALSPLTGVTASLLLLVPRLPCSLYDAASQSISLLFNSSWTDIYFPEDLYQHVNVFSCLVPRFSEILSSDWAFNQVTCTFLLQRNVESLFRLLKRSPPLGSWMKVILV